MKNEQKNIPRTFGEIILEGPKQNKLFTGDTNKLLIEKGWIKEFNQGQWVYTTEITKIFKAFQKLYREEVANKLGFKEWILPRLLPVKAIEAFGGIQYAPETLFEVKPFDKKDNRSYLLDPVQSASLYYVLSKELIDDKILPLKIFETMGGFQWRDEKQSELDIMRTTEYLKLELVYIGSPDDVVKTRLALKKRYIEIFNELELQWRIVVGAPCHLAPQTCARYEKAKSIEYLPLYDYEFFIPFKNSWLEVAGTCIEEDENIDSFGIKSVNDQSLWSGCSGVGLNRLVYAFVSQKGFDFTKYPSFFRKFL